MVPIAQTSEASFEGEAPQALPGEGMLNPIDCFTMAEWVNILDQFNRM